MVQRDRAPPSEHFHDSEQQSFAVWIFLRFRETELRRLNVVWSRVTALRRLNVLLDRLSEFHLVVGEVSDLSTVTWNARQEIKPDSILSRDLKTSRGALQGLSKAEAFW